MLKMFTRKKVSEPDKALTFSEVTQLLEEYEGLKEENQRLMRSLNSVRGGDIRVKFFKASDLTVSQEETITQEDWGEFMDLRIKNVREKMGIIRLRIERGY